MLGGRCLAKEFYIHIWDCGVKVGCALKTLCETPSHLCSEQSGVAVHQGCWLFFLKEKHCFQKPKGFLSPAGTRGFPLLCPAVNLKAAMLCSAARDSRCLLTLEEGNGVCCSVVSKNSSYRGILHRPLALSEFLMFKIGWDP